MLQQNIFHLIFWFNVVLMSVLTHTYIHSNSNTHKTHTHTHIHSNSNTHTHTHTHTLTHSVNQSNWNTSHRRNECPQLLKLLLPSAVMHRLSSHLCKSA